MHSWIARIVALAGPSAACLAFSQDPQTAVKPNPTPQAPHVAATKPNTDLDNILAGWEAADERIETLLLTFERIDKSKKWGDQVYLGQAVFKRPNLVCLEFKKAIPDADGKPKYVEANGTKVLEAEKIPSQRLVWSTDEVLQYEWDEQAIYVYPRSNVGLFRFLQRGPLPFLFNMKAAESGTRYGVTLVKQERHPDDHLIAIVPREEVDKESFQQAFVYLNKKTFLPSQVVLYPVGDKDMQVFRFTAIRPNEPIDDAYFHPSTNIPKWKVIKNIWITSNSQANSSANQIWAGLIRSLAKSLLPTGTTPEPTVQPAVPVVNPER